MFKCGKSSGFNILRSCYCKNEIFPIKHHCNLRVCPECAKIRKRRIVRQYKPFLESLAQDKTYFFYFLTISPKNYDNLEFGLKDIRKSFTNFLQHQYIKERIKAGFYVIETKGGEGNWNIHIHAIIYGRWLDNKMRGECLDCGQSLLKYNKVTKEFCCANHNCNSSNVLIKEDSKIVRLFRQSSNRDVHMHIQRQNSSSYSLNYMCKYISANKDDFSSDKDTAVYINSIKRHRLINSFGLFYNCKIPKQPYACKDCGGEIHYCSDMKVILMIEKELEEIKPPSFQKRLYEKEVSE
jgi:hypothetical protein